MRAGRLLIAILAGCLAATPALAADKPHDHAGMTGKANMSVKTSPADGDMGAPPAHFSATFPHAMRLTSLVVTPKGGDPVAIDLKAATAGATVTAPLPKLAPGTYTIAWTATAEDKHTMTGRVRYMVH